MGPVARIIFGLLGVGAIVTLGFIVYAADPAAGPSSWLFLLAVVVWALIPYALVAVTAGRRPASRASDSVLCAAAALLSGASIFGLYYAFIARPDPQAGLILIFLPLWQLVGVLPIVWIARRLARHGPAEG